MIVLLKKWCLDSLISDSLSASNIEVTGKCHSCWEETTRRCSKCNNKFFCDTGCERDAEITHIFDCCPGRPIDSADYLVMYCTKYEMPDANLVEGFGFERCQSHNDWIMLLELYICLVVHLSVSGRTLHQWQEKNTLARNICKTFEDMKKTDSRFYEDEYYKWFLNNKHFVDANAPKLKPEEVGLDMDSLRKYLPGKDKNIPIRKMEPVSKREVAVLYAMLKGGSAVIPSLKMWDTFGFSTCSNIRWSPSYFGGLCQFYAELFEKSTFTEFQNAYERGSLEKLARDKGMAVAVDRLKKNGVMIGLPRVHPSCYDLKQYVLCGDITSEPPKSVGVDYGFWKCASAKDRLLWKDTYLQLYDQYAYKDLDLHQACISGTIYDYIKRLMPDTPPEFKRLTSNLYPLEGGPITIR